MTEFDGGIPPRDAEAGFYDSDPDQFLVIDMERSYARTVSPIGQDNSVGPCMVAWSLALTPLSQYMAEGEQAVPMVHNLVLTSEDALTVANMLAKAGLVAKIESLVPVDPVEGG